MTEPDRAMESLLEAEKHAHAIDEFIRSGKKQNYTSRLLDRVTADPNNILKHWQGTHANKPAEMLKWDGFNTLSGRDDFKELKRRLLGKDRKDAEIEKY